MTVPAYIYSISLVSNVPYHTLSCDSLLLYQKINMLLLLPAVPDVQVVQVKSCQICI